MYVQNVCMLNPHILNIEHIDLTVKKSNSVQSQYFVIYLTKRFSLIFCAVTQRIAKQERKNDLNFFCKCDKSTDVPIVFSLQTLNIFAQDSLAKVINKIQLDWLIRLEVPWLPHRRACEGELQL